MRGLANLASIIIGLLFLATGLLINSTSIKPSPPLQSTTSDSIERYINPNTAFKPENIDTQAIAALFVSKRKEAAKQVKKIDSYMDEPTISERKIRFIGEITDTDGNTRYWFKEEGSNELISLKLDNIALNGWELKTISLDLIQLIIDGKIHDIER